MTSSVTGVRRSSKALPKAKFAPPKESWLLFGGLLPVWSTTANPSKTITSEKYAQQMDEMHQKPQQLHSALVNRKGPILPHNNSWLQVSQPTLQNLKDLGYKVFPHPPYSPDLSPTDYSSFKHLTTVCRENASTTSRRQKMLSKSSWNHKAWIFTLQE